MGIDYSNTIFIGVDIGGSHITAAEINMASKSIEAGTFFRDDIAVTASAETVIETWAGIIRKALGNNNGKSIKIGIAMPGPFDYINGISYIKGQGKYESL